MPRSRSPRRAREEQAKPAGKFERHADAQVGVEPDHQVIKLLMNIAQIIKTLLSHQQSFHDRNLSDRQTIVVHGKAQLLKNHESGQAGRSGGCQSIVFHQSCLGKACRSTYP